MKTKILPSFFGVLAITLFFFSSGWAQSKPDSKAPMITHSFAVEKGYYGYIWKIYIEAEDPDGDMYKIASVVEQPGYGHYPTDWIIIKPQYRNRLTGYIQWNTFSSKSSYLREWTRITLRVSIIDKAGNESNEVIFPFTFETGVRIPISTNCLLLSMEEISQGWVIFISISLNPPWKVITNGIGKTITPFNCGKFACERAGIQWALFFLLLLFLLWSGKNFLSIH